ncbi:AAA family ATPase [Candidatus Woesearchaeota archaeon]|nr:AAA family ATPase [Candidatus Woesearchaeota archaeon]
MPKPKKSFQERLKRLREDYERKGYKIVNSSGQAVSSVQTPQEAIPVVPARPKLRVVRGAAADAVTSSEDAFRKIRSVYKAMEEKGLYLGATLDVEFKEGKEKNIDEAGTQTTRLGGEAYNSVLLFSILTNVIDGKMLLYGPPGSGKTSTTRNVSSAIRNLVVEYLKYATVFGHPQQTEEKMFAMYDPVAMVNGSKELIIREMLKCPVKNWDELNRLPPDLAAMVLEYIETGAVTYQDQLIRGVPGPMYATSNPEGEGNRKMIKALSDRFNVAVLADRLNPYNFGAFNDQRARGREVKEKIITLDEIFTEQDRLQVKKDMFSVDFPFEIMSRVAHFFAELSGCDMAGYELERKTKGNLEKERPPSICKDCHHYSQDNSICSKVDGDFSARAFESLYTYSRALAYWRGKKEVGEEDIRAVIPFVTWFRTESTRAAADLDPRFKVDKISLFKKLYEMSERSYEEIVDAIPEYERITSLAYSKKNRQELSKDEIESLFDKAAEIDTPAKYHFQIILKKMYNDAK